MTSKPLSRQDLPVAIKKSLDGAVLTVISDDVRQLAERAARRMQREDLSFEVATDGLTTREDAAQRQHVSNLMKIGPGTIVLNRQVVPMAGEVIPPPGAENDDPGYVWVCWHDTTVGVQQELLQDIILTGKVFWCLEEPVNDQSMGDE